MERYQGKKVVIIGGTSGMWLATAKMLLDGGARVLVTGRSTAGLESAQRELGKAAIVVSSDARSLTDIDALAARVKAELDTFDLLFVNAGFSIRAPLERHDRGCLLTRCSTWNAKGPLFTMRKLTPLINRGGLNRPHDLRSPTSRECPATPRHGAAKAALRSFAWRTHRSLFSVELIPSRDSRLSMRVITRSHRHANLPRQRVSR